MGVSTDNSSSVYDVYIILNEIRPYQRVNPTGSNVTGNNNNNDYSTWNYTFKTGYATIQEGSNRMVSKITCLDHSSININTNNNNENLTKFNSLNLTGIGIGDNTNDWEHLPALGEPSLEISENMSYLDTFESRNRGSTIPIPNNTLSDRLLNDNDIDKTRTVIIRVAIPKMKAMGWKSPFYKTCMIECMIR